MVQLPKLYTVESVTSGHPDKVCDQISDAILDACLAADPMSRVAVETFGGHGLLVIGGEVTTAAAVDFAEIGRSIYRDIGYSDELEVIARVVKQSQDIAQGVDTGGAGDQGIMYGYATDETPEFLPRGIVLAHALTRGLETLRRSGALPWLKPDGKAQVTMQNGDITTVLVSCQHDANISQEEIRNGLIEKLIRPLTDSAVNCIECELQTSPHYSSSDPDLGRGGSREAQMKFSTSSNKNGEARHSGHIEILVNPTGKFVQGGFAADTGLTGRKIMVDTYGGLIPHGGGCFSGKDPTKVDRSGAYMARFAAKNLVAKGYATQCLVSVAYAIGRAEPLMVHAADETGRDLSSEARRRFDFRPQAIIERLNLRTPPPGGGYRQTATYGHFGKPGLPWEVIAA